MIVRRERSADHLAVRRVHEAAFRLLGGGDVVEARLVGLLREDAGFLPRTCPWSPWTAATSSGT